MQIITGIIKYDNTASVSQH